MAPQNIRIIIIPQKIFIFLPPPPQKKKKKTTTKTEIQNFEPQMVRAYVYENIRVPDPGISE